MKDDSSSANYEEIDDFELKQLGLSDLVEKYEKEESKKHFALDVINRKIDLSHEPEKGAIFLERAVGYYVKQFLDEHREFEENSPEVHKVRAIKRKYISEEYKISDKSDSSIQVSLPRPIVDRFELLSMMIGGNKTLTMNMLANYAAENVPSVIGNYAHIRGLKEIFQAFALDLEVVDGVESSQLHAGMIADRLSFVVNKRLTQVINSEIMGYPVKRELKMWIKTDEKKKLNKLKAQVNNSLSDVVSIAILDFIAKIKDYNHFQLLDDKKTKFAIDEIEKINQYCNKEAENVKNIVKKFIEPYYDSKRFQSTKREYEDKLSKNLFYEGTLPEKEDEEYSKSLEEQISCMTTQIQQMSASIEKMKGKRRRN